jgi:CBS domain-containing protein
VPLISTPESYAFRATNDARTTRDEVTSRMIVSNVARLTGGSMLVSEGMTEVVLSVGPGHTLRQAAQAMWERRVGAALVLDPDAPGPGMITERDILRAIALGQDPDQQHVADHLTSQLTFASPDWSLEKAAATMVRGGFRHLVVVDGPELTGVLSMRDIVRVWSGEGAACDVPEAAGRP